MKNSTPLNTKVVLLFCNFWTVLAPFFTLLFPEQKYVAVGASSFFVVLVLLLLRKEKPREHSIVYSWSRTKASVLFILYVFLSFSLAWFASQYFF